MKDYNTNTKVFKSLPPSIYHQISTVKLKNKTKHNTKIINQVVNLPVQYTVLHSWHSFHHVDYSLSFLSSTPELLIFRHDS